MAFEAYLGGERRRARRARAAAVVVSVLAHVGLGVAFAGWRPAAPVRAAPDARFAGGADLVAVRIAGTVVQAQQARAEVRPRKSLEPESVVTRAVAKPPSKAARAAPRRRRPVLAAAPRAWRLRPQAPAPIDAPAVAPTAALPEDQEDAPAVAPEAPPPESPPPPMAPVAQVAPPADATTIGAPADPQASTDRTDPLAAGQRSGGRGTADVDAPVVPASFARGLRIQEHYPRLPEDLSRRGREYVVTVEICVSPRGTVDGVTLRRGASPDLDRAVLAAIRDWRYRPWALDGVPIPFCHPLRIVYAVE